MADVQQELNDLLIVVNKAGGCRIALAADLAEHLAMADSPTNPERVFRPTGWEELHRWRQWIDLGDGGMWERHGEGHWVAGPITADPVLSAALDRLAQLH